MSFVLISTLSSPAWIQQNLGRVKERVSGLPDGEIPKVLS